MNNINPLYYLQESTRTLLKHSNDLVSKKGKLLLKNANRKMKNGKKVSWLKSQAKEFADKDKNRKQNMFKYIVSGDWIGPSDKETSKSFNRSAEILIDRTRKTKFKK